MMTRALFALLFFSLSGCAEAPEAPHEATPAAPGPFDAPAASDMPPWPVMGRDLTARDLFTAAKVTKAEPAMNGVFRPAPEHPAYAFEVPVDWDADPFGSLNWRFHFLSLRLIDPLINGWEYSGRQRYLDRTAEVAMDWVRSHPVAQDPSEDRAWADMTTGLRALRLVWLHDRVQSGDLVLPPEDLALLEASLDQHRAALLNPRFFRQHNHALYALHGLMAACRARAEAAPEPCAHERGYAREGILRVLRASYAADGGHKEHSPKYHDFVLSTLDRMEAPGWYDLDGEDAAVLAAAKAVSGWMSDADGDYPNVGDSERDRNKRAGEAPGPMPGCEDGEAPTCAALRFLPRTGYAILKTAANLPEDDRASLFLTCARHGRAHKHLDSLSFEWMDRGRRLLVDGGKYHYNEDAARSYLLSRAAHNTVAMDAKGADAYRGAETGSCLDDAALSGGVMTASGAATISDEATHARSLRYEVGDTLAVTDTVTAPDAAPFVVRWHLAAGLEAAPTPGGYEVAADGAPVMTAELPEACAWTARTGDTGEMAEGAITSDQYLEARAITTLEGRCPAGTGPVTSRFTLTAGRQPGPPSP